MRLIADASNNQRTLNVGVLAQHCDGLMHKATEGLTFRDANCRERIIEAHRLRLPAGAYHFGHVDESPREQATYFLDTVLPFYPETLQPALDVETGDATAAGAWSREWMNAVYRELGVWPLFYSYPDYIARMRLTRTVGDGLWLSSFSRDDGAEHPYMIPAPWQMVRMHQFTSVGVVAGEPMRLDLSHTSRLPFAHPVRARAHRFAA